MRACRTVAFGGFPFVISVFHGCWSAVRFSRAMPFHPTPGCTEGSIHCAFCREASSFREGRNSGTRCAFSKVSSIACYVAFACTDTRNQNDRSEFSCMPEGAPLRLRAAVTMHACECFACIVQRKRVRSAQVLANYDPSLTRRRFLTPELPISHVPHTHPPFSAKRTSVTVVCTSASTTPDRPRTPTRTTPESREWPLSSPSPRRRPSPPGTRLTPSTPCAVGSRCSPRSPRPIGTTAGPSTALRRS